MGLLGALILVSAIFAVYPAHAQDVFGVGDTQGAAEAYARGDYQAAANIWLVEAYEGSNDAKFNLGVVYIEGKGVPQSRDQAVFWFTQAAKADHAEAQYNLGWMYTSGYMVTQDYKEAVKWYNLMEWIYSSGYSVTQDYKEAVKWYTLAAEQGHVSARSNLGVMYFSGHGVPKDYAEAVKWFRLAAEQGHGPAQFNLGTLYAKGEGISKDVVHAYAWFSLAVSQMGENATKYRDRARNLMSPMQAAEAEKLTRELCAKIPNCRI